MDTNMHTGQELGRLGEQLAVNYLEARGGQILARNWRARRSLHGVTGELDVVMALDSLLVGVEVKTRSGYGYGHPLESITAVKLRRLHLLLGAWAAENGFGHRSRRVDAVAVVLVQRPEHPTRVWVEHLPGLG